MTDNLTLVFPGWQQLNFSSNCTAYGQWLSSFITPNPWHKSESLGGSMTLSIELFTKALPANWSHEYVHVNTSTGTNSTNIINPGNLYVSADYDIYASQVLQWYNDRLYSYYNTTDGSWYIDGDFVDNVIWAPADNCPAEFCKAIAFTGNADLSGVGVMVSYYFEGFLVSLYLVVFTVWRVYRYAHRGRPRRPGGTERSTASSSQSPLSRKTFWRLSVLAPRFFDALRGSLLRFLSSTMLLSVSMLIAAIVQAGLKITTYHHETVNNQNIPSGSALYDPVLALMVGLYSVFPVVVLYALVPQEEELLHKDHAKVVDPHNGSSSSSSNTPITRHYRRVWLRRATMLLLWALCVVMVYVSPHSEIDYGYGGSSTPNDSTDGNDFADILYQCDQRGGTRYWSTLKALQGLVIGVPGVWLAITGVVYFATRRRRLRAVLLPTRNPDAGTAKGAAWNRAATAKTKATTNTTNTTNTTHTADPHPSTQPAARIFWRLAIAWVACGIMWAILLSFTVLRNEIVESAGGLGQDDEWGFGQILAIANWVPVVFDVVYLMIFGMEAGLTSHLPPDYTVQPVERKRPHGDRHHRQQQHFQEKCHEDGQQPDGANASIVADNSSTDSKPKAEAEVETKAAPTSIAAPAPAPAPASATTATATAPAENTAVRRPAPVVKPNLSPKTT